MSASLAIRGNRLGDGLTAWCRQVFTVDLRSLALLRIGIGVVLLLNLATLVGDIDTFFTDYGMLPREARRQLNLVEEFTLPPYWVSLNMLSGAAWFQAILFCMSGLAALALLVGFQSSWATFLSWILLVGLQGRNPLICVSGDDILRCLLFWSIFLPLGDCWSIDRWRLQRKSSESKSAESFLQHPIPNQSSSVCSIATAALVLQLGCIYFFTALLKNHPQWHTEFTATYYALSAGFLTSPFGHRLLDFPGLLKFITAATLVVEFVGPLLLLWPARGWRLRTANVLVFWGLHLGIAMSMCIGLFPLICIVYWTALLPTGFWELPPWRRFWPARMAAQECANNSSPSMFTSSNLLVASLLIYVLALNMVRIRTSIFGQLPAGPLRTLGEAAQLNQVWCMFAPRPPDFSGWLDLRGQLADGTEVNLLEPGLSPQTTRPPLVSAVVPNMPWRKCMTNLIERDCPTHRRGVAEFLVRRWNNTHPADQQVVSVDFKFVRQPTALPDRPAPEIGTEIVQLWP